MALKLNGKDDNLRRADFHVLAATAGLRAGDADAAMEDMLRRISGTVDRIGIPQIIGRSREAEKVINNVLDTCRSRGGGVRIEPRPG